MLRFEQVNIGPVTEFSPVTEFNLVRKLGVSGATWILMRNKRVPNISVEFHRAEGFEQI